MQLRNLLVVAPLVALLGGCTYSSNTAPYDVGGGQTKTVPQSTVDTDASMAGIDPGQGAGAFIEYQAGGDWHLYTACDTAVSGASCTWDIIVATGGGDTLQAFQPDRLDGRDWVDWYDQNALEMVATTHNDFDGFFFQTDPGSVVRFDVYLDGAPAPAYIYWVGNGGLHRGAPDNPIDLTPTDP